MGKALGEKMVRFMRMMNLIQMIQIMIQILPRLKLLNVSFYFIKYCGESTHQSVVI